MIENSMEWKIRETKFHMLYNKKEYETIISAHNEINIEQKNSTIAQLNDYYSKRRECVKSFILYLTKLKNDKKDNNGIAEVL